MPVSADITRQYLKSELAIVADLAVTNQWLVVPDYERLCVNVTMAAHTGDLFKLEILCDNYKELPPLIEFIDPVSGARGTRHSYPKGVDSFFHDNGPCICAPFSRKAYKSIVPTGPHADWQLGDWTTSTANGIKWINYSTLGDILGMIYTRLSRPDQFKGRMA